MRWIVFVLVVALIDIYAFQSIRTFSRGWWPAIIYFAISIIALGGLLYELSNAGSPKMMEPPRLYFFGIFLIVYVPKLFLTIFLLVEDVFRILSGLFIHSSFASGGSGFMPDRRKFISTLALGIAAIPFTSLIYGMFKGKYDFRVLRYVLEFEDLPEEFDGYTITQLSDIHAGSFDNREKVAYGINLANKQKSDLIVLTGDLVNNVATEMKGWEELFSKLEATDGVFSILGNHDYGDYVHWENAKQKETNLKSLKDVQRRMGWDLLLNENRFIERNGEKIALIGVENWGVGFRKDGDLDKASEEVDNSLFKIVLTHDPTHWQEMIRDDDRNFHLTLSGHTHGMQFGIEIPGVVRWSPAQWRYKYWAGIYKDESKNRFLNVNRGFGYLAYPGRVGIWPEITVIELKKKRNSTG